jgi:antitoxin ParD1/3/4
MNISLPRPMKAWLDREVDRSGFGTASEYIRDLIRRAQAEHAELEESLVRALKEGPSRKMTDADWERIRRNGQKIAAILRSAHRPAARRKSA